MEDVVEARGEAKSKSARAHANPATAPDPSAEPVVPEPLSEIPATFEAREEKARKEIATRFETRFARDAVPSPPWPPSS